MNDIITRIIGSALATAFGMFAAWTVVRGQLNDFTHYAFAVILTVGLSLLANYFICQLYGLLCGWVDEWRKP